MNGQCNGFIKTFSTLFLQKNPSWMSDIIQDFWHSKYASLLPTNIIQISLFCKLIKNNIAAQSMGKKQLDNDETIFKNVDKK